MTNKTLIIGAGVVVLAAGGAAYAQHTLNQQVEQELAAATNSQRWSKQLGVPVTVEPREQNHGYLNSNGTLVVQSEFPDALVEIQVDYRIDHNVISGIAYEFVMPELTVKGDETFSLNDELFQGQPIRFIGTADTQGSQGQMLIPAVNGTDDKGVVVTMSAFPVDVITKGFEAGSLFGDYTTDALIPALDITHPNGKTHVENIRLAQAYQGSQSVVKGSVTIGVDKIDNQGKGLVSRFKLEKAALNMSSDLGDEASGSLELTLASASSMMGAVSDVSLKASTGGVDGAILKEVIQKAEQIDQSAAPDALMADLTSYLQEHVDALIAPSPYLQIEQMQFDLNGQRFVDASGKVTLQADRLPEKYFSGLIASQSEPDQQVLMSAVDASLDTSFGPQAAMMIGPMHPMLMGLLQNGQPLSFTLKNGQMMLNGQPL